jgi:hypothetical protein
MAGFGTLIIATDYNAIQSKISNILGTGSADYGYGQTVASSQVARNTISTVAQWNNLRNDLLKSRQHQTGNDEGGLLVLPTTSTTIKEVDRAAYNTFADIVTSNRLTIPPASQGTLANFVPATRTSTWASTISHTVTVTFASIDAARFYFNSGGNFKFSASFTNYTSDTSLLINRSWATLLTNMGIITMSANTTTNTGTGTPQNIGWYNLTTTNQLIFTKFVDAADSQYSPNQYDLYARRNAGSTQVIFTPTFSYTSAGAGGYAYEPANGTLTSISQLYYATGSNVSVAAPTAVVSGL